MRFNLLSALYAFSPKESGEALLKAVEKLRPRDEQLRKRMQAKAGELQRFRDNIILPLKDHSAPLKAKLQAARTIRNYQIHDDIDTLMAIIVDKGTTDDLRRTLIEALGWFASSYRKAEIIDFCRRELARSDLDNKIHAELRQTINRLTL